MPGATQFTRMPSGPNSSARAFVRATSAVLLMAYLFAPRQLRPL